MTKDRGEGFFAVDRRAWGGVCQLGVNAAIAYLVIARGTGGDQRTTSWSINAIEKYTSISRDRAAKAVQELVRTRFLEVLQSGKHPRYYVQPAGEVPGLLPKPVTPAEEQAAAEPDWIWLPNVLVEGVASETPPAEILRQTQDVIAIRMFVDLYHAHTSAADGGVDWRRHTGMRMSYKREHLGEWGQYIVWGFLPDEMKAWTNALTTPYMTAPKDGGGNPFWEAWEVLAKTRLVQVVTHLVDADSPTGEIMHPLPWGPTGETGEQDISRAAIAAALAMLLPRNRDDAVNRNLMTVPVLAHAKNVQLIGIIRMRYRPRTRATAAWFAHAEKWPIWAEGYRQIEQEAMSSAVRMQYQG